MFQSILSKQPRLNFVPFIPVFFFLVDKTDKVAEKWKVYVFFEQQHMHPTGPYISAKSKEAAHCGRLGALGTKKHKIKDERHGWFFSRFSSIFQG